MNHVSAPLEPDSEVRAGESVFNEIFRFEPLWPPIRLWFRDPFASRVKVLFPQNYVLDEDTFACFRDILEGLDQERDYLIRLLEAPRGFPLFWSATWSKGPIWTAGELPLHENCMLSKRGAWGIYFSDSDFALLVGGDDFLARLEKTLPQSFTAQKQALIDDSFAVFGSNPPAFLLPLISRL